MDYAKDGDDVLMQWKVKRKRTTVIAMAHVFIYGLENFSIVVTLLYYLKDIMKVNNPTMWYSFVMTSLVASESFSGLLFGKFMDKTRNARGIMLFNLFLSVIGNLMYTLQYNVWLLIVGRFLCGFGDSIQSVVSGKL